MKNAVKRVSGAPLDTPLNPPMGMIQLCHSELMFSSTIFQMQQLSDVSSDDIGQRSDFPMPPVISDDCQSESDSIRLNRDIMNVLTRLQPKIMIPCCGPDSLPVKDVTADLPSDILINELVVLLGRLEQLRHHGVLYLGLDEDYSKQSLLTNGVQALKGLDKSIYSIFEVANAYLDESKKLEFFIVGSNNLEKTHGPTCSMKNGGFSGRSHENSDSEASCYEDIVIGADGKLLNVSFEISQFDERNGSNFVAKYSHGRNCTGSTLNKGATKTNVNFHLVVLPKSNVVKVVFKNSVRSAVGYFERLQLQSKGLLSMKRVANDVVDVCVNNKESFCKSEKCVITLLTIMMSIQELDLVKTLLLLLSGEFSDSTTQAKHIFGIPSKKIVFLLHDLISAFGWHSLEDVLTKLIKSCPPQQYQLATEFLEHCREKNVPAVHKLLCLLLENTINSKGRDANLSDDSVLGIARVIVNHPESLNQFVKSFLDLPELQNVQMLTKILLLWENKARSENMKESPFYQMTFERFNKNMNNMFKGGRKLSAENIDAIVKGVEYLVCNKENALMKKLIDIVLVKPKSNLWKKLLESRIVYQSASVLEPIRCLIQVRIHQLILDVRSGEPKFSWCQPNAVIPDHPEVQAFLRGPERTFIYRKFNARTRAERFKNKYFLGSGSVSVEVIGTRSDTLVKISKSQAQKIKYDRAFQKYIENCEELKRLQNAY